MAISITVALLLSGRLPSGASVLKELLHFLVDNLRDGLKVDPMISNPVRRLDAATHALDTFLDPCLKTMLRLMLWIRFSTPIWRLDPASRALDTFLEPCLDTRRSVACTGDACVADLFISVPVTRTVADKNFFHDAR